MQVYRNCWQPASQMKKSKSINAKLKGNVPSTRYQGQTKCWWTKSQNWFNLLPHGWMLMSKYTNRKQTPDIDMRHVCMCAPSLRFRSALSYKCTWIWYRDQFDFVRTSSYTLSNALLEIPRNFFILLIQREFWEISIIW